MIAAASYLATVQQTLANCWSSQQAQLEEAAEWIATALVEDRLLHVFGTGHSHLLALEVFYRAGGLAQATPILEEPLMLHQGARASTERERESGYAARLLERHPITAGDVLVIASNSGRNAVPIEMAQLARERSVKTIAITSFRHSQSVASRHSSGRRLLEVVDLALDNGAELGDATTAIPGTACRMGPTSTVVGAFLMNALTVEAAARAAARGWTPAIYASANAGESTDNDALIRKFQPRIPGL